MQETYFVLQPNVVTVFSQTGILGCVHTRVLELVLNQFSFELPFHTTFQSGYI